MSACISRHGEYSDHIPDDAYTCTRCGVLDEDEIRAELAALRACLRGASEKGYANGYQVGHTEGVESMRAAAKADALQHRREGWTEAVAALREYTKIVRWLNQHELRVVDVFSAAAIFSDYLAAQAPTEGTQT